MRASLSSARARTTIGASLIVGAALLAVALVLTTVVRDSMTESIDEALAVRAGDLVRSIERGTQPSDLPLGDGEDTYTQIVGAGGAVVAASPSIVGRAPITDAEPVTHFDLSGRINTVEHARVHVGRGPGGLRIIVATSVEGVDDTVAVVTTGLAYGLPLVLLLVAGSTWVVVGRTLVPVEAIRAEVSTIGHDDLHRRVPEPGSNDEIGRLARTMNVMLDRLEKATERQDRFVSDAAHELRTPLATIRHELEVALLHGGSEWPEVGRRVLDEDLRIQRLVDDLLCLARTGRVRATDRSRSRLIDVDDVAAREASRQRSGGNPAQDGEPVVDTAAIGVGQIRGSADDLARVVRNLVDNATRHARSRVTISVTRRGDTISLAIEDDGPGVAPSDRELIFEPFARLDHARSRADGGTGLGLAIVAEVVDALDGTVEVSTSPRLGGARFAVSLPAAR